MGRSLHEVLVTPAGGGESRPLLVFLHGYGATPSEMLSPAFLSALRRLGDRAPVIVLPEGEVGWWHDRAEGLWGSYVLREAIPAALGRSGADRDRVAIGGISMGGFGALDLGRTVKRFCAIGGHSPAVYFRGSDDISFGFDNAADFARHDLLRLARNRSPYDAPVWIDVGDRDQLRPAAAALARDHARLPRRPPAAQQGDALPGRPADGGRDRRRDAPRRRRPSRLAAARDDRRALARRIARPGSARATRSRAASSRCGCG